MSTKSLSGPINRLIEALRQEVLENAVLDDRQNRTSGR